MEDKLNGKWKQIWEKRADRFDEIDMDSKRDVFVELKRIDGFDVVGDGIGYDALIKQHEDILKCLSKNGSISSVFDVGCGCGANMYLFKTDGLEIGGMDYSCALIEIAKKVFKDRSPRELLCDEAKNIPTDIKYDAILANSVFSYFPSEAYAEEVLDKMLVKTNKSIGLVDLHDIDKKDAFVEYRRKTVENYDERYKGLDKFFYSRDFFASWGAKNGLEVQFCSSEVEGYWNNEFVFDVFFYKK